MSSRPLKISSSTQRALAIQVRVRPGNLPGRFRKGVDGGVSRAVILHEKTARPGVHAARSTDLCRGLQGSG